MTKPSPKKTRRFSLKALILLPFSFLLFVVVFLVGFLSYMSSREAISEISYYLGQNISLRVINHIETFITETTKINEQNSLLISSEILDLHNQQELERYFLEIVKVQSEISSIYFGSINGGLVGTEREIEDDSYFITGTENFEKGPFYKYSVTENGERKRLEVWLPDFDGSTRPWYQGAQKTIGQFWTDPYIRFAGDNIAIARSKAVFDNDKNFVGVLSIDISLGKISRFLQNLEIGKSGYGFICDGSGLMLAASTTDDLLSKPESGKTVQIKKALDMPNPQIADVAEYFFTNHDTTFSIPISGETHLVQVLEINNLSDKEWFSFVVLPETDFLSQIRYRNSLIASIAITLSIIIVTLLIAISNSVITAPIIKLDKAAKSLGDNNWSYLEDAPVVNEINSLYHSFNKMSSKLEGTVLQLQQERGLITTALNAMQDIFFVFDPKSRKAVRWNKIFTEVTGYQDSEIIDKRFPEDWHNQKEIEEKLLLLENVMAGGSEKFELNLIKKNGESVPMEYRTAPLLNKEGEFQYVLAIGRDITERIETQKRLQTSLEEKEILLKELHHRTKNNMNVISSLLNLEANTLEDKKAREALASLEMKIHSMALVHQMLHSSDSLSHINLNHYLRDIAELLMANQRNRDNNIELEFYGEDINVIIDIATPCGLILNEIVSNSLEHGFSANSKGKISIALKNLSPDSFELIIADNGQGFPSGMAPRSARTLGLQTVFALAEDQLHGEIEVTTQKGVAWKIRISNTHFKERV